MTRSERIAVVGGGIIGLVAVLLSQHLSIAWVW